jgi:hypothetical protein
MKEVQTLADLCALATDGKLVCRWCDEPVSLHELRYLAVITETGQVTHYECVVRSAAGSVGHQKKLCSCYGGKEEDPPGMTRREAAKAAAELFHSARPIDFARYHQPG